MNYDDQKEWTPAQWLDIKALEFALVHNNPGKSLQDRERNIKTARMCLQRAAIAYFMEHGVAE
jgi:hypothetical protein